MGGGWGPPVVLFWAKSSKRQKFPSQNGQPEKANCPPIKTFSFFFTVSLFLSVTDRNAQVQLIPLFTLFLDFLYLIKSKIPFYELLLQNQGCCRGFKNFKFCGFLKFLSFNPTKRAQNFKYTGTSSYASSENFILRAFLF